MNIDRETIQKAKEKLGDKNAFLIAEIQDLKGFDEKNLKAFSPLRDETVPSYVYDKKRFRFKDFGSSSYSADVIDAMMEKGKTFLEACQYLFKQADIPYSFGEMNVQTRSSYKYPHEEPLNERENVKAYLGKRGINSATIDYLDIREDEHGNCVFNYYDTNDVLTLVKYRPSRTIDKTKGEIKTWCQKDADTTPLLFNMGRVNPTKPLLITEGELDTASAIFSGYINTVSVPFGAGNFHWIEENWDWLEQFHDIIIWADNDEPGEKMRKECINRLGSWRTKYIQTPKYFEKENGRRVPLNDINDCLQVGGKEFVLKLIADAKDVPVTSVIDYADIEELDMSQVGGVKTGLKPVDKELVKLYNGTLTILSGRPGSGKTSLIDQIAAESMDNGNPVFLFSKELPPRLSANWFNTIIAGRRNQTLVEKSDGASFYVVPYDTQKKMQNFYKNKLLIYKDSEPNDSESVMRSAEECVRKYGAKLVILDNLMMLDLKADSESMNLAQTKLVNELINFASKYDVVVVLIAHPKKTADMTSDVSMYDISGSSNIINLAIRSIGLRRVSKKEKEDPRSEWGKYDVVLTIIKDRLFGKQDIQIGLWYDNRSRRFYTDYEEYDRKFAWDDRNYFDKLEYVDRSYVEEFPA